MCDMGMEITRIRVLRQGEINNRRKEREREREGERIIIIINLHVV